MITGNLIVLEKETGKVTVPQFDELKEELTKLVAPAETIKVADFPSSHSALETAKAIKGLLKRIETKRKELVEPLKKQAKTVDEYANDIKAPLERAEAHIKRELAAFEEAQEKIRKEELRKAEEERLRKEAELLAAQEEERENFAVNVEDEAEAADLFGCELSDPEAANIEAKKLEESQAQERARLDAKAKEREWEIKQKGVKNARKIWKCEAIDLSLVPKEFLIIELNSAAIIAAARGGVTNIPGVKIWQETTIAIGAR